MDKMGTVLASNPDYTRYRSFAQAAEDALAVWNNGASNPLGVTNALLDYLRFVVMVENKGMSALRGADGAPARLMLAQLAFLLGSGIGDYPGVDEDIRALYAVVQGKVEVNEK